MTRRLGSRGWLMWGASAVAVVSTVAGLGWMARSGQGVAAAGALRMLPIVPAPSGEAAGVGHFGSLDAAEVFIQGDTVLTVVDVVSQLTTECRSNDTDPAVAAATFAPGLPAVNPDEEVVEEQPIDITVRVMLPSGEERTTRAVSYRLVRVVTAAYLKLDVSTDEGAPSTGLISLFRHDGAEWTWGGGTLPSMSVYFGQFGQGRPLICGQPTDLPAVEPQPEPGPSMPSTL